MNPKLEAFVEQVQDFWLDMNDHVRGLIIGLVAGFILGAVIF